MSGETKIGEQKATFAQVVSGGQKLPEIEWVAGRILLTNKRVILGSAKGKRTIALDRIISIKCTTGTATLSHDVDSYLSIQHGKDVVLIAPQQRVSFEQALYRAIIDDEVLVMKHPAVEGGVVQDTKWTKGKVKVDFKGVDRTGQGELALASETGTFVTVAIDDVGTVNVREGTVMGSERQIVEVGHTEDGVAVQTHLSGPRQRILVISSLLRTGELGNTTDVELSQAESTVLMALYSGVSPFQIPDFTGMDVDEIERIYEQLEKANILEEQRIRREVRLKARGRAIASDAMDDE